ncbi:putative signaling protein [Fundidesulfovibrio magnetotacticus]|uniref:Putative signaling protein n=1 Tax=Fundidesulfovibrio magnetotacticus TaxID=2730080 RepID=A0A6V8LSJ9_9BACT|nr:sensor domain-containing diguanylate cyclase [Fundidesulfovibrio magnetotacticus]GFK93288.1 putative signaling protein [Fundidesulfovibrio magnetotacticus]
MTPPRKPASVSDKERTASLEEARRRTLERLERLISLGIPEGSRSLGTVIQVLDETAARLRWLMPFRAVAFFMVREPHGDFYLARCQPQSQAPSMERELALLVDSGSAGWALQRRRPVFTTSELSGQLVLLHSMTTASRIRGMFLGVPAQEQRAMEDDALAMVSLVLRGAASLLEGIELYGLLREANAGLKAKVAALEKAQRVLRQEVGRRCKAEEMLTRQALHDPLTGLANRVLIMERLQQAVRRAQRRDACHAVAYLDLDRFKLVNDTLGHAAGDQLLTQAGRRMAALIRQSDTLARFGGDEFVLFLEEVESPAEALQVMRRILSAMADPFEIEGHAAHVTASIGLVAGSLQHQTPQGVLKNANTALHTAKEAGRNRVKVFNSRMQGRAQERSTLLSSLRRAVEAGRTDVAWTPTRLGIDGAFDGFEAVPCWKRRGDKALSGAQLVELARHEAVAWDLWLVTLRGGLAQLAQWDVQGDAARGLTLSLSLFLPQQPEQGFAQTVREALDQAGLDGARLRLLIPMETLVKGGEPFAQELGRLRQAGVRFFAAEVGERFFRYRQEHPGLIEGLSVSPQRAAHEVLDANTTTCALMTMARIMGLTVLNAAWDEARDRNGDTPRGPASELLDARQARHWAGKAREKAVG